MRVKPPTALLLLLLAAPAAAAPQPGGPAAAPDAPRGPFGTVVCAAKEFRYALTAEDALWTARMLVGESGGADDADNEAVVWCMLNSYAIRPLRMFKSFTEFIRAYSTPLQPYLKSKAAIERHRKRKTPMVEVEPGKFQLKRHVEIQKRPWADLPAGARALVERIFTGKLSSVCGNATQFCSTAVYFQDAHDRRPTDEEHEKFTLEYAAKHKYVWRKVEGADPRKNCFFEEERYKELSRPAVKVVQP